MNSITSIFDGTAQWSLWFVVATVVKLLIFLISTSYLLCYIFWNMGWPLSDNFYKIIIEKESDDLNVRREIKKLQSEIKRLKNKK